MWMQVGAVILWRRGDKCVLRTRIGMNNDHTPEEVGQLVARRAD